MKLKAGIIGISSGNGHPYAFSAIINGYNEKEMAKCRFEVIPEYLKLYKNQKFISFKCKRTRFI